MTTRGLWVVVVCLALLGACGTPSKVVPVPHEADIVFAYAQTYEAGVTGVSSVDGAVVWHAAIGHSNWAPIMVGDSLYTCVSSTAGTHIMAVRIADGQVLWRTKLPSSGYNYVINADSTTVVVNAGENGMYVLDALTGAIRWHLSFNAGGKSVLGAGVVYTFVPREGSYTSVLTAFQASDGKHLWTSPDDEFGGAIINSTAAFGSTPAPKAAALGLRDGRLLWTSQVDGFPIAATESAVFVQRTNYTLAALSATDGSVLWESSVNAGYYAGSYNRLPNVNGVLYIVNDTGVAAIRARDGTFLWRLSGLNYSPRQVIVVKGVAYVYLSHQSAGLFSCPIGDCADEILALNAASGATLWRHAFDGAQQLAEPVANQ
ncbi:MAG TPA: PQQ-binding-like beta-propeller repeat protein [Ktedonobacterales bacterium]